MRCLLVLVMFFLSSCFTRMNFYCKAPAEYQGEPVVTIMKEAKKVVEGPPARKAITFCIYGSKKKYTYGVLENIELAKDFYPGWDVVVFADSKTVPHEIIEEARKRGAKVFADPKYNHASARFFIADSGDYDLFISRDADSRIYQREVAAVADWMKNDWAILHAMHDAENHHKKPLRAGMFGARVKELREKLKAAYPDSNGSIEALYHKYMNDKVEGYGRDEDFLEDIIYKTVGDDFYLSHESYECNFKKHSRGFPIPRGVAGGGYIGGIRSMK